MKYNSVRWENGFRHDGLLYFNQRLQEMLSHYTDHVYAVPVCNTLLLANEYLATSRLVNRGLIREDNLKYILDEFINSFMNDIVISYNISEELRKGYINQLQTASKQEKETIMRYITSKLSNYFTWSKAFLANIVTKEKEKKKIEEAMRCFVPSLIGAGYSREFIYFYNKKVFNDTPVSSLQSLNVFLDRFDCAEREYTIYLAIKKTAKEYQHILEQRLHIAFDVENEISDFKYDKKAYILIRFKLSSFDERTALRKAKENLELFFNFNSYQKDKCFDWLNDTARIVNEQGTITFLKLSEDEFCYEKAIGDKQLGMFSEAVISHLMFNVPSAFSVIKRVTEIHNSALVEKDINNAFLRLWSIFEIFFLSEHSDSRINEIEEKVVRILVPDYFCTLFGKIEEDLFDNVNKKKINEIRNKIGSSDSKWIQELVLVKGNSEERKMLIDLLADYPIIRSRICQLNEKLKDYKSVLILANQHRDRLKWHIRRLYRTRNAIIHSGDTPHAVKELLRHLHNYVDQCINEMIYLLMMNREINSIQSANIEIKVRIEMYKKELSMKKEMADSGIPSILFSPYR